MRLPVLMTVVLAFVFAPSRAHAAFDPLRSVDPFIGTGGHGHTFPGATLPFGMVQLSPDTRLDGWDGCSGYHDDDRFVHGFSHTHLSGTGVSDSRMEHRILLGERLLEGSAEKGEAAGGGNKVIDGAVAVEGGPKRKVL